TRKQLGSGLADYGCNSVAQHAYKNGWTLRVNNGMIFSGNTLTGVIGLRAKGFVYVGGFSLTHPVTPKLQLGAELTGNASTKATILGKANLQTQIGLNYSLSDTLTFDFGTIFGWFSGSPRVGLQIGLSKDF
ncbi:MAG: hypothetical protein ABI995_14515, partial [Acidobacteriota bacterium]